MTEPNADAADRRRQYHRDWYRKNRDRLLVKQRQYQLDNRDALRAYKRAQYLQNREQVLQYQRIYHAQNRDKILERQRAYRARNRERIREAAWRKRHSGLSPQEWAEIWETQQGLCYLCGFELTEADTNVDHDHGCCAPKTSCPVCRRGLAHSFCNIAIGYAADDPARLRRMADALEAAKAAVAARMAQRGAPETLF